MIPAERARERARLVAELLERFALADRRGAVARTRELRRAGVPANELREAIAAAVGHVGDMWQSGRWTITQEHAATAVAEAVLASLEADLPVPGDAPVGTVAVAAAEGEWHALPGRLASHAFESAGLQVRYLGGGIPADDVARTLPSCGADVLAISITLTANLVGAARTVTAGRAAGLPVLTGGAASSPARAAALGADAHAGDVDTGAAIARAWCLQGPPRPATATVDLRSVESFRADRERLRDAAYAATEARWPALAGEEVATDRTDEDLELHLDHLAAALLVEEDDAYLDLVRWLVEVHVGRGLPPEALVAQVAALDEVLDDPRWSPLLAAAVDLAAGVRVVGNDPAASPADRAVARRISRGPGRLTGQQPSTGPGRSPGGRSRTLASVNGPPTHEGRTVSDTRVYDVPEISCDHCKNAIEGAVDGVEGVSTVQVDVDARTVTVAGDAPDVAVRAAIVDAGYEVAGTR